MNYSVSRGFIVRKPDIGLARTEDPHGPGPHRRSEMERAAVIAHIKCELAEQSGKTPQG